MKTTNGHEKVQNRSNKVEATSGVVWVAGLTEVSKEESRTKSKINLEETKNVKGASIKRDRYRREKELKIFSTVNKTM